MPYALLVYFLLVSAFVYVCICGPSRYHRDGYIGQLYVVLTNLPTFLAQVVCTALCCSREKGVKYGRLLELYFCESRNPTIQVLYVVFTAVALYVWYSNVWPMVPADSFHQYTAPLATVLCISTFPIACASDPGVITADNVDFHMELFPLDNVMYQKHPDCRTCERPRPARSKHCRLCNTCVAKYDHHCAWINSDVGLNNYRYFMLFIVGHVVLCVYGTYLCFLVMWNVIVKYRLFNARFVDAAGNPIPPSFFTLAMFLTQRFLHVVGIALFMITLAIVLTAFFFYHAYLVTINMTSNETFKYSDLRDAYEDEDRLEEFDFRNVYDRGFAANWREVLWPPCKPRTPAKAGRAPAPTTTADSPPDDSTQPKRRKKKQK